jgi:hypothetical protein
LAGKACWCSLVLRFRMLRYRLLSVGVTSSVLSTKVTSVFIIGYLWSGGALCAPGYLSYRNGLVGVGRVKCNQSIDMIS